MDTFAKVWPAPGKQHKPLLGHDASGLMGLFAQLSPRSPVFIIVSRVRCRTLQ